MSADGDFVRSMDLMREWVTYKLNLPEVEDYFYTKGVLDTAGEFTLICHEQRNASIYGSYDDDENEPINRHEQYMELFELMTTELEAK